MPDTPAMKMPKTTDEDKAAFRALVPEAEDVTIRPMFGSLAAFAGGQMFMGILGTEIMIRLADSDREAALAAGSQVFEPMPGRPMREYVTAPNWRNDTARVRELAESGRAYALSLPPKKK
jgi:TfoX/Sxy family transcriptional regulator of competence genes